MSALGHKRTFALQYAMSALHPIDRERGFPQTVMSALPPKADVCGANRHVCFGPRADIVCLFDDFVREREKFDRNLQFECLCGLEVDHKVKFGRLHNRQVPRFLTL
jgi:hypothetical protein